MAYSDGPSRYYPYGGTGLSPFVGFSGKPVSRFGKPCAIYDLPPMSNWSGISLDDNSRKYGLNCRVTSWTKTAINISGTINSGTSYYQSHNAYWEGGAFLVVQPDKTRKRIKFTVSSPSQYTAIYPRFSIFDNYDERVITAGGTKFTNSYTASGALGWYRATVNMYVGIEVDFSNVKNPPSTYSYNWTAKIELTS